MEFKEQLIDFLSGGLSLPQLSNLIEDRLFELRQTPEISEEQSLLSHLELIIHECAEGLRSDVELFERIRITVLPWLVSTIDISPTTDTTTETIHFAAAPVTEYLCVADERV